MRAAEFLRSLADMIDALDGKSNAKDSYDAEEKNLNPVMVPPLQQHLELEKAEQGKESPVIDKITANDNQGAEPKQHVL
jgi:hypothetical protein